jgi:hypothetical protein
MFGLHQWFLSMLLLALLLWWCTLCLACPKKCGLLLLLLLFSYSCASLHVLLAAHHVMLMT